jgi:hypothetical protein
MILFNLIKIYYELTHSYDNQGNIILVGCIRKNYYCIKNATDKRLKETENS